MEDEWRPSKQTSILKRLAVTQTSVVEVGWKTLKGAK